MMNNYGYYGYQPYMQQRQVPQPMQNTAESYQPLQTTMQSRPSLNGKQVDSVEVVKAMDIPLDGSISYFPIADGSAIVTKQLQMDGTSKIIVFKPFNDEKQDVVYVTKEDMEKAIKNIDFSDIDDLKDELKEIRQEIKDMKKKKKDD